MSTTTLSSSSGGPANRNFKRHKYSKFTQQELSACKPILTPRWVIAAFMLVGIVFIPIGVVSLLASRDVVEIVIRYEDFCVKEQTDAVKFIQSPANKTCHMSTTVPKTMKPPIFIYYQIKMYQNHRRYVKSRSDAQLKDVSGKTSTSDCKPEDTNGTAPIVPCGLIAWSLFNDTYSFFNGSTQLTVNKKGISWESDRNHKFGKDVYPENFQNGSFIGGASLNKSIPLNQQEDLIVWMRTAALPTFRKLYGKIEMALEKGEQINITIQNNYNTYSFNGKKKLVLSTTSWLGGKNDFLGIAYLTAGSLCFFLAMVFAVVCFVKPRQLGDPSYLSWNRNPAEH